MFNSPQYNVHPYTPLHTPAHPSHIKHTSSCIPFIFLPTHLPTCPPTHSPTNHQTHTVGDCDLVNISAIRFESAASAGASTCDAAGAVYNDKEGVCVPLPPYAIRAGPRRTIYYDPAQVCVVALYCGYS